MKFYALILMLQKYWAGRLKKQGGSARMSSGTENTERNLIRPALLYNIYPAHTTEDAFYSHPVASDNVKIRRMNSAQMSY